MTAIQNNDEPQSNTRYNDDASDLLVIFANILEMAHASPIANIPKIVNLCLSGSCRCHTVLIGSNIKIMSVNILSPA